MRKLFAPIVITAALVASLSTASAQNVAANPSSFIKAAQSGQLFCSKLIGTSIFAPNGEKIGTINDLLINKNSVDAVIVRVGGFLGLGGIYVAVPTSAFRDEKGKLVASYTKVELGRAPAFTKR